MLLAHDEGFLEAIREAPDDDVPRLVYADWLEERGEPLGEFIRVQCQLARLPADDPARPPLEARERELLDAYETEWLGPLAGWVSDVNFIRGFLDHVRIDFSVFLDQADAFCRLGPVRSVALFNLAPLSDWDEAALADHPGLARVVELDLRGLVLDEAKLRTLIASPHLTALRSLRLSTRVLDLDALRALADSPHLAKLEALSLNRNLIGDDGVEVLSASDHLTDLRTLELDGNSVSDHGVWLLARSPLLGRLRVLSLRHNVISCVGAQALAASPFVAGLRGLDLEGNYISDAGLFALAACRSLAGLKGLGLGGNPINRAGLEAWAASPYIGWLAPR